MSWDPRSALLGALPVSVVRLSDPLCPLCGEIVRRAMPSGEFREGGAALDEDRVPPGTAEAADPLAVADVAEAARADQGAAGTVLREDGALQGPGPRAFRGGDQGREQGR